MAININTIGRRSAVTSNNQPNNAVLNNNSTFVAETSSSLENKLSEIKKIKSLDTSIQKFKNSFNFKEKLKLTNQNILNTNADIKNLNEEIDLGLPDVDTINPLVNNSNSQDFFYNVNEDNSDFVINNLLSIVKNTNETFQNIEFPNVLSHELIKKKSTLFFETNESSLDPSAIYEIKKDYIESIHITNANRYFIYSEDSRLLSRSYVDNLNTVKTTVDKTYTYIKDILESKDLLGVENNFGNKLVDFYLNDAKSSSLGKIASIILDNKNINFAKEEENLKSFNQSIERFTYNSIKENFSLINPENLAKIIDLKISHCNSFSSYLKNASKDKTLVNSDRLVGQNIINLSLSLDGYFKDSLSYDFWKSAHQASDLGGNLNSIVDSKSFNRLPIVKLDSILSLETNSNGLFNNFNNDKIYSFNENIFDLSSVDYFDNKKFLNDTNLKESVFDVFEDSLYLTNIISKKSNVLLSSISENGVNVIKIPEKIREKEKYVKAKEGDDFNGMSKYISKYFNPFIATSVTSNFLNSFYSYMSDITFTKHSLTTNNIVLRKASQNSILNGERFYNFNQVKSILSGFKFLYFSGKTSIGTFNKSKNETGSLYKLEKINNVCLDTKNSLLTDETQFDTIRKYTFDININSNIFKDEYEINENYKSHVSDKKIKVIQNKNSKDVKLKEIVEKIFKGQDLEVSFSAGSLIDAKHVITSNFKDRLNTNKDLIKLTKGFVLFQNTQKTIDISKMKDKFILYDQNLTSNDEFINNRIIKSSASFNQESKEDTQLIFESLKDKSFKYDNWEKIAFDLRRNIFNLKKNKIKNSGQENIINYLNEYKEKSKKVKKINSKTPYLSLLYSNDFKNSIDTLDSSEFIVNTNDFNYKKFDFSDSNDETKTSFDFAIENGLEGSEDFSVRSSDIKSFISSFYTDSELKSSSVYFNYCYKKVVNIVKEYCNNLNTHKISYDMLLSDAILNSNNDNFSLGLLLSSVMNYKEIKSDDAYEKLNEDSGGIYKDYIESIYSFENIQRQKSFTLRTVKFPDIDLSFAMGDPSLSDSTNQANVDFNWKARIADMDRHNFNFGVMPGDTFSIVFPMQIKKHSTGITGNSECLAYDLSVSNEADLSNLDDNAGLFGGLIIADALEFSKDSIIDDSGSFEALYDFTYSNFYNYDSYLDNSSSTIGENNQVSNSSFNTEANIVSIRNIVRRDKFKGSDDLNEVTKYRDELNDLTNTYNAYARGNGELNNIDNITGTLNYRRWGVDFKDYGFYSFDSQPRLKNHINNCILEILKFLDEDFDVNIAEVETIEAAISYIETFKPALKTILNLLKVSSNIFSTIVDNVIELSLYKKLGSLVNDHDSEDDNIEPSELMNIDVFNILGFEELISRPSKYQFEKEVKTDDHFVNNLYLKLHADIQTIDKVLNNSDILEIMSFDTLSSYLVDFDNFRENNLLIQTLLEKSNIIEENTGTENILTNISNEAKFNILSKKLNDFAYYQQKEYQKVNAVAQSDFNIPLKERFRKLILGSQEDKNSFFETHLEKEKSKSILAKQGITLLNDENTRYDIIRFGIDYKMAELLSDNKVVKFKIHISNHKYPNVLIPPVYKLYTPVLTEITPSHLNIIEQESSQFDEGVFIEDFIGMYDYSKKDLKERYNIVSFFEAVVYIRDELLGNINNERLFRSENTTIDSNPENGTKNAVKIVTDAIYSNAVKYSNYRSQKNFDEDNILNENSSIQLIGDLANILFDQMSPKDFEETFGEPYEKASRVFNEGVELNTRMNAIENNSYFVDFFNLITEFTDDEKITNIFEEKKLYDVFSIMISRSDIKNHIINYYTEDNPDYQYVMSLINSERFFDSFSYTIEAEIV